jgi:hypothetical protein
MGEKWPREFCQKWRLPRHFLGSFTCRKARHGTDGFTSPPLGRCAEDFFSRKSDGFGLV